MFRDYFEAQIKPHIDGSFVEYLGTADLAAKNQLLGNSLAMLFPIQWDEPFGLVLIEAMACGTPVLALPGGSVSEIVADRISGYVCHSIEEMARRTACLDISPISIRRYAEHHFSVARMTAQYDRLYQRVCAPVSRLSGSEWPDETDADVTFAIDKSAVAPPETSRTN